MKAIIIIMAIAAVSVAGFDMGIGMTVVSELNSSDYGWTGTVSASVPVLGVEWATRATGVITYPAYHHHPVMSFALTGTGAVMMDGSMGMEAGGGVQYRDDTEEWVPVIYYGWLFELSSGHDVRPFVQWSMNDTETIQAGFLFTFGN